MTHRDPVLGVLDWGVGGLGVVNVLRQQHVNVPILYVSDTGVVAYGKLARSQLATRVDHMIEALGSRGATHILIACNAASTVIDDLHTALPVTGTIIPALTALATLSPIQIGVIGGTRTIRAGIHRRGLEAAGHTVRQRIAQPLSGHIELGTINTERGRNDLRRIVMPLRGVHTLVLACTHYPAITPQIQALLPQARVFDPALEVAQGIARTLGTVAGTSEIELGCTGDAHAMREAATRAWGRDPGPCNAWSVA